jgi:hypothetical protein
VGGVLETEGGQIGDLWAPLCRAATGGSDAVWASWPTGAEGDRLLLWWGSIRWRPVRAGGCGWPGEGDRG